MEDLTGMPFTQSRGVSDSYRWFAPELCCAPGILSTASDVFAYGMTLLEVCIWILVSLVTALLSKHDLDYDG